MTEPREPIVVHCAKCNHEWAIGFAPLDMETFAKAAKQPCPVCRHKTVLMGWCPKPTPKGDWRAWKGNGDTGVSSETIWSVFTGKPVKRHDVPHDPDDFGRCYRLLQVMPEWRARLGKVATKHPSWSRLVAAWEELTQLYEEELPSGHCPHLYARMKELGA